MQWIGLYARKAGMAQLPWKNGLIVHLLPDRNVACKLVIGGFRPSQAVKLRRRRVFWSPLEVPDVHELLEPPTSLPWPRIEVHVDVIFEWAATQTVDCPGPPCASSLLRLREVPGSYALGDPNPIAGSKWPHYGLAVRWWGNRFDSTCAMRSVIPNGVCISFGHSLSLDSLFQSG